MAAVSVILKLMKEGIEYDPATIATATRYHPDTVRAALKSLTTGGVIEQSASGKYFKDRKFKTKQKSLI